MSLVLDGTSEHVAQARRKIGLETALDLIKFLKQTK